MDTEVGIIVAGLLCGGLTCIGLAVGILVAVFVFWNRNTAPEGEVQDTGSLPIRPSPSLASQARTVLVTPEDLPPEPEPDLFDEEAMSTVVAPPSGSLPSEPPPPPSPPPAPADAPPANPLRKSGQTIIAFDDDEDDLR